MSQSALQIAHDYQLQQIDLHLSWKHFAQNAKILSKLQYRTSVQNFASAELGKKEERSPQAKKNVGRRPPHDDEAMMTMLSKSR